MGYAPFSILVIDDDRTLRNTVQFLLELEGYRVRAVTAPVAMALMGGERPDLVLLDLDMPLISGHDVHSCLRADPETATVPVVTMATARQLRRDQASIQAQGMLVKPFTYTALLAEVAKHLTVGCVRPDPALDFAPWTSLVG